MEGQFDRPPRRQKLVALYGEKFPRSDPKTEFFNTISPEQKSAEFSGDGRFHNGLELSKDLYDGSTFAARKQLEWRVLDLHETHARIVQARWSSVPDLLSRLRRSVIVVF